MRRDRWFAVVAAASVLMLTSLAPASQTNSHATKGSSPGAQYFTDTILVDQNARQHRFYSDLIAGRIVIMNIIFTSCRSSCPIIMGRLVELQDLLGSRRSDVSILSISVDPIMDTPQILRAYAEGLGARSRLVFPHGFEGLARYGSASYRQSLVKPGRSYRRHHRRERCVRRLAQAHRDRNDRRYRRGGRRGRGQTKSWTDRSPTTRSGNCADRHRDAGWWSE